MTAPAADDELTALLAALTDDELADLVDELPAEVVSVLAESFTTADVHTVPDSPLTQAQALDPLFIAVAHLRYLSGRVAAALHRVEAGENVYIAVTMPPRMGKTTQLSKYLPVWVLRLHPDWPIILTSHSPTLVTSWGRSIRRLFTARPDLGVHIASDAGAASEWETTVGGSVLSRSLGGDITGRGAKVLVIDDPHKGLAEAHSEVARNKVWDWWTGDAYTRLDRGGHLVIVVMCMSGDTPVLLADGTERPLRDVRPGDEVATYEDGALTTATVRNWANQGPDSIYEIRMSSGAVVRANARHPFLTIEGGEETWTQTSNLKPGTFILRATGGSTAESPAQRTGAVSPRSARACACRTTTRLAGQPVTAPPPRTPHHAERPGSSTATASPSRSTTRWWKLRMASALSAENRRLRRTPALTGPASSASTMTTEPARCEACSATTATSPSVTGSHLSGSAPPLTTWSITPDEVVSVTPTGVEDVYDVQIDRTENFIANGLVSHNTRWHEDDLIGRLLSVEHEGNPDDWEVISFPAIAEEADVLGRTPGDPLISPQAPDETREEALSAWGKIKAAVGSYVWAALYLCRPAPSKGQIFDVSWFRYWTVNEANVTDDGKVVYLDPLAPPPPGEQTGRWLDSWDMAFKAKEDSDFVVGSRWLMRGANRYLVQQFRGRITFTATVAKMRDWSSRDGTGATVYERLVEDKANGTAVIDTLKEEIAGIIPIDPTTSKIARARSVTPEVEAGNVLLPYPGDPGNEWVADYLAEFRSFPTGAHDDQVDATVQALRRMRGPRTGSITVPGRQGTPTGSRIAGPMMGRRIGARDAGRRRSG